MSTAPHESEGFACPNEECGKVILEPLKMNDLSKTPKETFYVCPHCMSKLDMPTVEQKSTPNLVPIENPMPVENAVANKKTSPQKCPHYLGYLKERPKDTPIPNECLTCPETIECLLG